MTTGSSYDLVHGYRRFTANRALSALDGNLWARIADGHLPRKEDRNCINGRMINFKTIRKDLSLTETGKTAQVYGADPIMLTTDVDSAVAAPFQSAVYQLPNYNRKFARLHELVGPYVTLLRHMLHTLGLTIL